MIHLTLDLSYCICCNNQFVCQVRPCNVGTFSKVFFDKHVATKPHKRVLGIAIAQGKAEHTKITN